jgi:tagatose 1,6-diphosphate aldolase
VKFSGVLCGRATWQQGIPIFANEGIVALSRWLESRGVQNIQTINNVLARCATPWWDVYGGRDNIEIIETGRATSRSYRVEFPHQPGA